ncbi:MAG: serine hydrolase, partial [Clostridia bacterium]|nr:serine hydrolase [Clostridia bacterium]
MVDKIPNQVKEWTIKTMFTYSTGYEKFMLKNDFVKNVDEYKLLDYVFETPIKYSTNTHFTYNNVEPYLLSVFFKENFGVDISDFINEKILKPLGVKNFVWN